jgi:hypothetical protein
MVGASPSTATATATAARAASFSDCAIRVEQLRAFNKPPELSLPHLLELQSCPPRPVGSWFYLSSEWSRSTHIFRSCRPQCQKVVSNNFHGLVVIEISLLEEGILSFHQLGLGRVRMCEFWASC